MGVVGNGFSSSGLILPHHSESAAHPQAHVRAGQNQEGQEGFNRELEEIFSKLNPMATEFVPPSLANNNNNHNPYKDSSSAIYPDHISPPADNTNGDKAGRRGKKGGGNNNMRKMSSRTGMAQHDYHIRRTVYVTEIDRQITEEQLAALFLGCGQVVDCRICGDPKSILRFAFVEFTDEEAARVALTLSGTMLGYYPVKVVPSKTAIAPVNPTLLPQTEDEVEKCARTVYVTNIDKKVPQAAVRLFFETICGEVHRLKLLGDNHYSSHIAFVEFAMAESAIAALNCSGVILGLLPIRVSPSKTPVRPKVPRSSNLMK